MCIRDSYITDEQGNKILDEEADYSGYYRDIPVSYTHLDVYKRQG